MLGPNRPYVMNGGALASHQKSTTAGSLLGLTLLVRVMHYNA